MPQTAANKKTSGNNNTPLRNSEIQKDAAGRSTAAKKAEVAMFTPTAKNAKK